MRSLTLTAVLVLSHMPLVGMAAETNVEQVATGPTIDGLALAISCSNNTYRLGERICIQNATKNYRKEVVDFGARRGRRIPILTNSGGHLVSNIFLRNLSARIVHGRRLKFPPDFERSVIINKIEVAPGESHRHPDIVLDKYYVISSPGVYRLILIFRPNSSVEELLFSNMIEFRVLEAETDPENE